MWNKRFNIVIYCLPSLYMVTKAICPLWYRMIPTWTHILVLKKIHLLVGIIVPIYKQLHMSKLDMMLHRGWRLLEIDVYLYSCSNLFSFLRHDACKEQDAECKQIWTTSPYKLGAMIPDNEMILLSSWTYNLS